ncbi:hypothetical protein BDY24DRAFT_392615 [Mrakia frigida]|uniref:uncharacterized protein n=1 Tax=Mrakia frigida TaxID=29902 RepID=UPI003FCC1719
MASFTKTMLERYDDEVTAATTSPFLTAAGKHELSKEILSEYLTQDKIYAFVGYPKFIANLISHLPLLTPTASTPSLLKLFSFALTNVARETSFFADTADNFGLTLSQPPQSGAVFGILNSTTKAYVDFLTGTEDLEEGLVLLWGMEQLYLKAWQHAKSQTPTSTTSDTSDALKLLIDNWTCEEFEIFVQDCVGAVEGLELVEGSERWKRCEEVWKYVLWLEVRFWPSV